MEMPEFRKKSFSRVGMTLRAGAVGWGWVAIEIEASIDQREVCFFFFFPPLIENRFFFSHVMLRCATELCVKLCQVGSRQRGLERWIPPQKQWMRSLGLGTSLRRVPASHTG